MKCYQISAASLHNFLGDAGWPYSSAKHLHTEWGLFLLPENEAQNCSWATEGLWNNQCSPPFLNPPKSESRYWKTAGDCQLGGGGGKTGTKRDSYPNGENLARRRDCHGFLVDICLSWKKFFPFLMSLSHICLSHKWSMNLHFVLGYIFKNVCVANSLRS